MKIDLIFACIPEPVVLLNFDSLICPSSSSSSSCAWQLGSRIAIILLGRNYAADAVPLYQYTGTLFTDLGRMTG